MFNAARTRLTIEMRLLSGMVLLTLWTGGCRKVDTGDIGNGDPSIGDASVAGCRTVEQRLKRPKPATNGVDILMVVDNQTWTTENHMKSIVTNGVYAMINALSNPLSPEVYPEWGFPPVDNLRFGIVSSDMGLQWGGGEIGGNTTPIPGCANDPGKNGALLNPRYPDAAAITLESGRLRCEPDGGQCPRSPAGWECNEENRCVAPTSVGTVDCPGGLAGFVETGPDMTPQDMATAAACMVPDRADGCAVVQPLEAALRGLENNPAFLGEDHLLAVLVVSGEEDCSIASSALFQTDAWTAEPSGYRTACTYPEENQAYLFPPERYRDALVALKGGQAAGVIFSAIVGVPAGDESPCQGDGNWVREQRCLEHDAMQLRLETAAGDDEAPRDFAPACSRQEEAVEVMSARPGRRFVEVAGHFGADGYVYSICSEDWTPALRSIAEIVPSWWHYPWPACADAPEPWRSVPSEECDNCGETGCELLAEFLGEDDQSAPTCPDTLLADLDARDMERYLNGAQTYRVQASDGTIVKATACPIPELSAPRDCDEAVESIDQRKVGWYYCEKEGENFSDACTDGEDNDGDGDVDCADDECEPCLACGGDDVECELGCRYGTRLTDAAKNVVKNRGLLRYCREKLDLEGLICAEEVKEASR